MHLWSDYEGKTIDTYPLGQLIRPEGRSAFFLTRTETGTPDVIRLTESLNDEAEMMERWRQVSELKQEHLVKIKRFGQTKFESTPLAFALMESSDGSLAEILRERPLTPAETREVATSVISALRALHENGLVHEHVEPANVMAVGEVVKLRSDCVRECRLDSEFLTAEQCEELKRGDVAGLATILLQALTLEKPIEGAVRPGIKLPAPFDKIVAKGLDGTWGLKDMDAALNPPAPKVLVPESVLHAKPVVQASVPPSKQMELPVLGAAAGAVKASNSDWSPRLAATPAQARESVVGPALHVRRSRTGVEPQGRSAAFWAACAGGLALLLLLGWLMLRTKPAAVTPAVVPVASAPAAASAPVAPAAPSSAPVAVPPGNGYSSIADAPDSNGTAKGPVATSATQPGWHVVAYTYNHEDQARAKVASIREHHSSLSPEVFAPSGRAPYLVGLGGAMGERDAELLRKTARREGLPRDVYVRRYGAR